MLRRRAFWTLAGVFPAADDAAMLIKTKGGTMNQSLAHLDDVQLGQQVAVGQGHFITVQELAVRELDVLNAVVVDLVGQRRAEILVQLLQRLQEAALQSCEDAHETL